MVGIENIYDAKVNKSALASSILYNSIDLICTVKKANDMMTPGWLSLDVTGHLKKRKDMMDLYTISFCGERMNSCWIQFSPDDIARIDELETNLGQVMLDIHLKDGE